MNDQHPEPPIHPANGKSGPRSDCLVGIGGKRTGVGLGNGHFAEHAHDQNDKDARKYIRQNGRRPGGGDGVPGPDEQAGTNDAGNRKHGDVTRLEPLRQLTFRIFGARTDHCAYSLCCLILGRAD
ncbi:hypothetical protein D3C80_1703350 [compost metagenome]